MDTGQGFPLWALLCSSQMVPSGPQLWALSLAGLGLAAAGTTCGTHKLSLRAVGAMKDLEWEA